MTTFVTSLQQDSSLSQIQGYVWQTETERGLDGQDKLRALIAGEQARMLVVPPGR
jgi:hypothetical protein